MAKAWLKAAGSGFFLLLSAAAFAADTAADTGDEAVVPGIQVGAVRLYPAVDFALKRDDNLFSSDLNKRGSTIEVLRPRLALDAKKGVDTYTLGYEAEIGRYNSSSADNYEDQQVYGDVNWDFAGKMGLKLHGDYLADHDARGSTDRASGATPDRWHQKDLTGVFAYGGTDATGRIEIEAGALQRRYQNNRATTLASDRDNRLFGATFFYRIYPKTSLLFQAKDTKFDYIDAASTLDSNERRYLIGATWEAAAKTTGIFKIGQLKKDFNSAARQDYSGTSWEAAVNWSPLTYADFDLITEQQPYESTGLGDAIVSRIVTVAWNHAWSGRVSSRLSAQNRQDDFRGAGVLRQDDIRVYSLGANYQMRRWLKLGASYENSDRSSTDATKNYRRNVTMLTVALAF